MEKQIDHEKVERIRRILQQMHAANGAIWLAYSIRESEKKDG